MSNWLDRIIKVIREKFRLFLTISFGIFLFVLFFQPFPIESFEFNNRLLIVAGLGAIVFLIMVIVSIIFTFVFFNTDKKNRESDIPQYLSSFIIVATTSVAYEFYLHFVGMISITFFITLKVVLICMIPIVVLGLNGLINELKQQNELLVIEKKIIQQHVEKYEDDILNRSIEFVSENISENFSLLIAEVAFIRSADNYVEIVYKEGEIFKKKLIRNTLKNIEIQISLYSNFIRCHRICIVNRHYIEKLNKSNDTNWLSIKGYDEHLPVSRQYLLKLKETL
jgi:DNA-binding LytR/AlgR family response regulator